MPVPSLGHFASLFAQPATHEGGATATGSKPGSSSAGNGLVSGVVAEGRLSGKADAAGRGR